jgi:hypothetical protein
VTQAESCDTPLFVFGIVFGVLSQFKAEIAIHKQTGLSQMVVVLLTTCMHSARDIGIFVVLAGTIRAD